MSSNIKINIVEPGSPTPIDPAVPNTGLFTHGIGTPEATIIVSVVLVLAIVSIVLTAYMYRRHKKVGKVTKLVHIIDSTKAVLKSKKRISSGLAAIALLISAGTFIALAKNGVNASEGEEQATEDTNNSSLTVTESSQELTVEVGDSPVFAIAEVEVTVEEATQAGYTLTAYTDNTDLVSTTDGSKVIPMVVADEGELVALADNTYGLALDNKPASKDEGVYTTLSTDAENPTFITDKDYEATEENDTTTIYYGFYITPDMPKGTYVSNSEVVYDAIPNLATVTFDANGLYYNNDESLTTNTLGYKPNVAEAPIELVTGEYLTPAPLNPDSSSSSIHYTFLGWSEDKDATEATYVDEQDILANLTLSKNESLTLYAVWYYNTVLSFNGNTSDGGEPIADITIPAGTTITLPPNTYTRTGSVFTGWNTVAEPTEQDPGEDYEDEADFTAPTESADITLYAQWAYYTTITFSGNGADSGTMTPQDIIAGDPTNLVPNAYTKTNHTFIGWNTVQNPTPDNPGTTYQDQAEFIASTTQHEDITLYAQWASTTISFNGNTSESGTMNPIIIPGGEQVTLPQNAYTKSHCTFTSWNTSADGTGTRYPGEASYTASMDGIYSFTLYAQWQCESMINFSGNGADSGYMAGIMATGGQQTTLPQNTFTKDGYAFNGWNTKADGTGESYPDQGTYIAPVSESQNITLYAQWKQVFYMQDVAIWGSTLSQGDTMEAVDSRDGKTYWVAKLADGNIWMTQNLDLDIEAGRTYTSADTDLANSTIGTTWTPTVSTRTTSGWTSSSTAPSSYDPGNLYWNSNVTTSGGTLSNRTTTDPSATSGGTHYHVGNYYNWTAAVAMSDSSTYTSLNTDVNQSICPAGWRLPTYSGDKSYLSLKNAQGFTSGTRGNIQKAPTYFVYGGYYWNGGSSSVGYSGSYWSSVVEESINSRLLYFGAHGNLYPQTTDYRSYGDSLRCVAR